MCVFSTEKSRNQMEWKKSCDAFKSFFLLSLLSSLSVWEGAREELLHFLSAKLWGRSPQQEKSHFYKQKNYCIACRYSLFIEGIFF